MSHPVMIFPDHWSTQKRILMAGAGLGAPLVEYTATGNPLSFVTNIVKPLKSLVLPWTPTQSGTGDPSPENVRPISGVSALNVWQYPENVLSINRNDTQSSNGITFTPIKGTNNKTVAVHVKGQKTSSNVFYNLNYSVTQFEPGTYKVYGATGNCRYRVFILDSQGKEQSIYTAGTLTFTIPNDAQAWWMRIRVDTENAVDETIYPIVLKETDTLTTYPVTFPALGKNLFSAELEQGAISGSNGQNSGATNRVRTKEYIPLKAGTYTVTATGVGQAYIYVYGMDESYKQSESSAGYTNLPRRFILTEDRLVRIAFRVSSSGEDVTPSDVSKVMLNAGTTEEPYEPYTNTVYGGSLDLTTGVLTVEWAEADLGKLTYTYLASLGGGAFWTNIGALYPKPKKQWTGYCSEYKYVGGYAQLAEVSAGVAWVYYYDLLIKDTNVTVDDPAVMKAALDGVPLVYEIEEPYTVQLTPTEVSALLGDNVIWSDINGSNTAIYYKKG